MAEKMTSISVLVDAGATAPIKIDTGQLDQLVKDLTKGSGSEKLLQSVQTFADRAPALIGFVENRIERFESAFLAARLAGTSNRELRALQAAGQELGLSADAMRSGVQSLHRSVRDDPAVAAALGAGRHHA